MWPAVEPPPPPLDRAIAMEGVKATGRELVRATVPKGIRGDGNSKGRGAPAIAKEEVMATGRELGVTARV